MPRLRYLRFTATSNDVQPPSNEFCGDVAKILSFFPTLESFELWGIHFEQAPSSFSNCGQQWRPKMFGPLDVGESHLPPPDLFSEYFVVY